MLFTRFLIAVLPFVGVAFGAPIDKRDSVVTVVDTLRKDIAAPVLAINSHKATGKITSFEAQTYLQEIITAIDTAKSAVGGAAAKRSVLDTRQTDLNTVGTVLAEVITEVVEAVETIAKELEGLPLLGALVIDIDAGLNTLLLGVEIVLTGVVEIVQGLLSGLSGLLLSLGDGLLASTLGF